MGKTILVFTFSQVLTGKFGTYFLVKIVDLKLVVRWRNIN